MSYFKEALEELFKNTTKLYLILANTLLVVFAIWFSNAGLLPFKNVSDFAFFALLALILGLYRPGWTFLFFIGTLALESINLAPKQFGLMLRPYQFFGFITIAALLVQVIARRLTFSLPKFRWYDGLPIIFAAAGFLSSFTAISRGVSLKQSIILSSFIALYFLVRIYVQSIEDAKRIVPFFLSSGLIVVLYAVWQNVRFIAGANSFEVMPGRPNGTFAEPDWLGIYLVFLLATILTIIYQQNRKNNIIALVSYYLFLTLVFVALVLTVSRSAWLGAAFVIIVFLKFVVLDRYLEKSLLAKSGWKKLCEILKFEKWVWKKAGLQLAYVLISAGVALLFVVIAPLTHFQLGNRAASTGGLQKITIACNSDNIVPAKIEDISQLAEYGCRHINLEDIEKERAAGNEILEILRPDPNVNIRSVIYQKSIAQIKLHPVFGIGWGNISQILGTDDRGAGLNASNIFLEIWLGSGLLGLVSFVVLLGYVLISSISLFLSSKEKSSAGLMFVIAGLAAIVVPNLFNSGIFLGFVWVYLAVAAGLLSEKFKNKNSK